MCLDAESDGSFNRFQFINGNHEYPHTHEIYGICSHVTFKQNGDAGRINHPRAPGVLIMDNYGGIVSVFSLLNLFLSELLLLKWKSSAKVLMVVVHLWFQGVIFIPFAVAMLSFAPSAWYFTLV